MVEVFKTNITDKSQADSIVQHLHIHFPSASINFDLDDCDKILRVVCNNDIAQQVIITVKKLGYQCELLEE